MRIRPRCFAGSYTYLIALQRLRLVVSGDVLPREDEPVWLMGLLAI